MTPYNQDNDETVFFLALLYIDSYPKNFQQRWLILFSTKCQLKFRNVEKSPNFMDEIGHVGKVVQIQNLAQ